MKPAQSSNWWRTVKQKHDGRQWDVYTDRRLTDHPADDIQPRFNRGATQIVFVSGRDGNNELYRMDADGANLHRLTVHPANDETPDWSPDNQWILFVSNRDGNADLFRISAGGADPVRLTFGPEEDLYPSWSPDGSQIAWVRRSGQEGIIWVMNADGSEARPVTEAHRLAARVRWSPDGAYLAFDFDADGGGANEPALINVDGSALRLLTCEPSTRWEHLVNAWLPNSSGVVVTRIDRRAGGRGLTAEGVYLYLLPLAGCGSGHEFELHTEETRMIDISHVDPWPPASRVRALPRYSRLPNLVVSFDGEDVGPSGVWHYQLQMRTDANASWLEHYELTMSDIQLGRLPAGKLYLRSRALDFAGNWEPWPPEEQYDTETTLFTWRLTGNILDPRGTPRRRRAVAVSPTPLTPAITDAGGAFETYLGRSGRYVINNDQTLLMQGDRHRTFYELPVENLVQNGGFEDATAFAGWVRTGDPLPSLVTEDPHSSRNAARLGHACASLCPPLRRDMPIAQCTPGVHPGCSPDEVLDIGFGLNALLADRNDTVHLLGRTLLNEPYYQRRDADGSWRWAEVISQIPPSIVTALADDAGRLSFVWADYPDSPLHPLHFFRQRRSDGTWGATEALGASGHPNLVLDDQGRIHMMYTDRAVFHLGEYVLFYRSRTPNGVWSDPEAVATIEDQRLDATLALLGDGAAYLFWVDRGIDGSARTSIRYRVRQPNGGWSPLHTVLDDFSIENLKARRTRDNELHLFWTRDGGTLYTRLPVGGEWTPPEALGLPVWAVLADAADTLYAVSGEATTSGFIGYRAKPLAEQWGEVKRTGVDGDHARPQLVAAGAANSLHAVWATGGGIGSFSYEYHPTPWVTQTIESALSQRIQIPADMHRPTLAFFYTLEGGTTGASRFAVTVSNEVTTTAIFSATAIAPLWTHGWADLELWAGETVTITFGVSQPLSDTQVSVLLDRVSVGPWTTPVVHDISPANVEVGVAVTLRLTGENFFATPTVHLGEQRLATVRWVDEQHLEVSLPPTLGPGIYPLTITNPDGSDYVHPSAVAIGKLNWLPLIRR